MANEPETKLKHVPLVEIHEPDEALRKVDKSKEEYVGLVESIRIQGVMNPITVRELKDGDTGDVLFGLVDGLQRFSASKDAGKETIPCHVISCEDGQLIEAQIMANVHKIETKPVEYSRALLKILQNNPLMSRADLANRLAKTGAWISERLGLLKLTDEIGKLVDEDKIGLSNAYALAKLPPEEQADFVDRAMTMTPQQFTPTVNARVKEIRDAKRAGRNVTPEEFQAIPILRTRKELVAELETSQIGPALCGEVKPGSIEGAFALGVQWALNMDPRSQEVQRARDEERRAEQTRQKEKSTLERKKKRAAEAAEKAAKLKEEAEQAEKSETGKKKAAAKEAAAKS
ncbi:MAG: ParB/RepB/Spo0J family partition protein [Euryarchaeota archaeon]|nr:ParB/RepB/Spo0J family partition protein [Euryarchaeota archaeon]